MLQSKEVLFAVIGRQRKKSRSNRLDEFQTKQKWTLGGIPFLALLNCGCFCFKMQTNVWVFSLHLKKPTLNCGFFAVSENKHLIGSTKTKKVKHCFTHKKSVKEILHLNMILLKNWFKVTRFLKQKNVTHALGMTTMTTFTTYSLVLIVVCQCQ